MKGLETSAISSAQRTNNNFFQSLKETELSPPRARDRKCFQSVYYIFYILKLPKTKQANLGQRGEEGGCATSE